LEIFLWNICPINFERGSKELKERDNALMQSLRENLENQKQIAATSENLDNNPNKKKASLPAFSFSIRCKLIKWEKGKIQALNGSYQWRQEN
jgi:hypothetical protein